MVPAVLFGTRVPASFASEILSTPRFSGDMRLSSLPEVVLPGKFPPPISFPPSYRMGSGPAGARHTGGAIVIHKPAS